MIEGIHFSMHRPSPRPNAGAISPRLRVQPSSAGPGIGIIEVVAPLAALAVGIVGLLLAPVPSLAYVTTTAGLPTVIVGLVLIDGRRSWARPLAAAGLVVETILAGVYLPAGLAFAVILPFIAIGLVQTQLSARHLQIAFVVAGVAATLGVCAAILVGPAGGLFGSTPAILTISAFVTVIAFALTLNWRATRHLVEAVAVAEGEVAAHDRTEAELSRTAELLSAVVRSSPVATQAIGLNGLVTTWNPAAERIFGWTAAEMIGRPLPPAMTPPDERDAQAVRIARTIAGEITAGDRVRPLAKDGRVRWIDIYAAPLRGRDGRSIGVAGQLVDVTERVQLEAQLLQAQKMSAIGLLASGLAHDFNNTLTAAGGFAALIEEATDNKTIRSDAESIIDVVERARKLTRQLLTFASESDAATRPVDVRAVVNALVPLIRQLIGPEIEILVDVPQRAMIVRLDAGQLEQAIINLAVNARDAMPNGGTLVVAVKPGRRNAPETAESGALGGAFVEIAVRDSGTGIPYEVQDRIFEPFFTTKGPGRGSGLGLAMVSGFAARAGGEVTVESEPGKGTTFAIRLPDARPRETRTRVRAPRTLGAHGITPSRRRQLGLSH